MKSSVKFIFLLLFGILRFNQTYAQVVFTSSDLALPGSVITYGITETDETTLSFGENVLYDFSSLPSSSSEIIVEYHAPDDFPGSAFFSDVNLVMTNSYSFGPDVFSTILYTQLTKNSWNFLGEQFNEQPEPYIYDNTLPNLVLPLEQGLNESLSYTLTQSYFYGQDGIDSLKSVLTVSTEFACNSWGQLILPDATYDVVLVLKNLASLDSSFSLSDGEWVFTDLIAQNLLSYEFYSPQAHCMVMRIEETEGFKGEVAWSVTYLKNSVITKQINPIAESFEMYPNPAQQLVNIVVQDSEYQNYEILDVAGKVVASGNLNAGIIGINAIQNGMYLMHIKDTRFNNSRFKRLIIEK